MEWNVVKIAKKLGLLLTVVILVALSLPGHIVLANGTTVEVNSGKTITLNVGGSQSNIPMDIRGIVVSGNATGLAAFDFTLNWNPTVIRVDTVKATNDALDLGWGLTFGAINNVAGTVRFLGTTTQQPYSKANLTMAYLGITAVGSLGKTTTITITITNLVDNARQEIPALPVNAPVEISLGALRSIAVTPASPSIALGQTQQFTATGTYTLGTADITNSVSWSSSNTTVAIITTTGLATSLAAGTTAIIATLYAINGTTILTVTEAKTEEVMAPHTEAEPGVTNVSGSVNETGVFAEESTAKSEGDKFKPAVVKPATDEGTNTVEALLPKPINWGLIGGIIAGVVVIGVVIWLALRRKTA